MNPPSVHYLLKKYNIRPKKRLGQHFLTALPIMEKIADAAGLSPNDNVLEIGAGLGLMTLVIAGKCRAVYAVEKDKNLLSVLSQEFSHIINLKPICADILKLDLKTVFKNADFPIKVIGNVPYNISTPILFRLFANSSLIKCAVITLQKEVAGRILAKPNCKDYGILSILSQTQAVCSKLFDIKPNCFLPPPKVLSTAIHLDFEFQPNADINDRASFSKLVKTAFGKRRKTIRNALMGLKDIENIDTLLSACRINPTRRPETLSIDEYILLANYLSRK